MKVDGQQVERRRRENRGAEEGVGAEEGANGERSGEGAVPPPHKFF